jgi:hypothetical protein
MKYWIAFLLFLSSFSSVLACGPWYPYGEDTRFTLLYPGWFDNGSLSEFYYSADRIAEPYIRSAENDKNTLDWWNLVNQSIDKEIVFHTIYGLSTKEVIEQKNQPMIEALRKKKGETYIDYLVFAKTYSHLNNNQDYWERNQSQQDELREEAAETALNKVASTNDEWLKRRYAFLALRFYFYSKNETKVVAIYDKFFKGKSQWAIDRWAEFHSLRYESKAARKGFRVAQLFKSVDSKRPILLHHFPTKLPKEQVLEYAKKNNEKANIHAMYILREKGKTLEELKTIYKLDPTNELLKFLIVREVNKLENWVLGPEITAYEPVINQYDDELNIEDKVLKERIKEDRLYAKELLNWLMNKATKVDPDLRAASIAVLSLITNQEEIGIKKMTKHRFALKKLTVWRKNMLILLKARTLKNPELDLFELDNLFLVDYKVKNAMIFALGRTFEFQNNLKSAILLYAHLNNSNNRTTFTWSESNGRTSYNDDYYYSGFDYFDANYTAEQVERSWSEIQEIAKQDKNALLINPLFSYKWEWYDMVGTKHLREEQLEQAIKIWQQIPEEYWYSEAWNYDDYLQANPFYANFYSSHKKTKGDTISFTKLETAQELQKRIKKSEKLKGDEKAKVLFDIANCYFNMTQYGNSWMMKRYYWSQNTYNTIYSDNEDYNRCLNAKKYYLAAKDATNSSEFEALCLRMAGRCESYSIRFDEDWKNLDKNKYYQQLKKYYPEDESELLTNCHSFEKYYASIKN